jgi:hypothetical protein
MDSRQRGSSAWWRPVDRCCPRADHGRRSASAEASALKIKLNESGFIGVLAEDPTACYAALLQKLLTQFGTEKTQVVLFATTVVKRKMIFYYLFSPYVSADTVTAMVALHKKNVAALLAANGN